VREKSLRAMRAELHDLLLTLAKARRVGESDGQATRRSLARRGIAQASGSGHHGPMRRQSCSIAPRFMIRDERLRLTSRRRPSLFESPPHGTVRRPVSRARGVASLIGSIYQS
jgi:hypothetical protein